MFHGYTRVKVNAGLSASNKTNLEGQGTLESEHPQHITSVIYGNDGLESISEVYQDSIPTASDFNFVPDELEIFAGSNWLERRNSTDSFITSSVNFGST